MNITLQLTMKPHSPHLPRRAQRKASEGSGKGLTSNDVKPATEHSRTCVKIHEEQMSSKCMRREALLSAMKTAAVMGAAHQAVLPAVGAVHAIPLAPLGKPGAPTGDAKRTGLSAAEIKDILSDDLTVGQYFVTGNLTKEIFADDCRFKDPTNDIVGLARYVKALGVLFDPARSSVELLNIEVTGSGTVEADWTLGGYLVFPWNPKIERIQGHTVYSLNADGLIQTQEQMLGLVGCLIFWATGGMWMLWCGGPCGAYLAGTAFSGK
ncbi:hypothetical protein CYMTET_44086 [Cymbomonas tetramitiformis]|uniref:Uncharacterized protein n=1 Tax=Cymbomonas tetramitiformis TaxID=36881 RepID=A0AAE0C0V9_9CHLO|nr:hypothetical protein CYMTET_44086 [Cymbomonas tetramitiformis]